MKAKTFSYVLLVLLLISITAIIYLIVSNPVRGYRLVYARNQMKLFIKDTGQANFAGDGFGGGSRVAHAEGIDRINKYRNEDIKGDPSMTKFITFSFDSVMTYMTYILTKYAPNIGPNDTLGVRVYIAKNKKPTDINGNAVYLRSILLAPTNSGKIYDFVNNSDFDFFDQGSICPINCPDDDGSLLNFKK